MSQPFDILAGIDVSEFLESRDNLWYLNWARALTLLLQNYPDAQHEVIRFPDEQGRPVLPYLKTECGYFVEVAVTVKGDRRSCLYPVMGETHDTLWEPTAVDINNSLQRALTKAIAMHGLGLYVYAGEDVPPLNVGDPKPQEQHEASAMPNLYQFVGLQALSGEKAPYYMLTLRQGKRELEAALYGELMDVFEETGYNTNDYCHVKLEQFAGKWVIRDIRKVSQAA